MIAVGTVTVPLANVYGKSTMIHLVFRIGVALAVAVTNRPVNVNRQAYRWIRDVIQVPHVPLEIVKTVAVNGNSL
jgi:hypothetical protein